MVDRNGRASLTERLNVGAAKSRATRQRGSIRDCSSEAGVERAARAAGCSSPFLRLLTLNRCSYDERPYMAGVSTWLQHAAGMREAATRSWALSTCKRLAAARH